MINKKITLRLRLKPRIWDPQYILVKSNLKTLNKLARLTWKKNPRILDIGCGYKPFNTMLSHKEFVGIDFDKESSEADWILDCNKQKIPCPESYFDVIIMSEVLEHVFNTDFLLNEVRRVLKKKGYLFISTPFVFCEHGVPHDFYRFTRYFYLSKFKEYKLISMRLSNTFFSIPFLICNQLLEYMPISVLRIPFIVLNNLIILIIETISKLFLKIVKNKLIHDGFNRYYEGISVIFRK